MLKIWDQRVHGRGRGASCARLCVGLVSLISSIVLCVGEAAASELGGSVVAYVGPGAGLGMLASVLAVLVAIVVGIFGLILYPFTLVRRMIRQRKEEGKSSPSGE